MQYCCICLQIIVIINTLHRQQLPNFDVYRIIFHNDCCAVLTELNPICSGRYRFLHQKKLIEHLTLTRGTFRTICYLLIKINFFNIFFFNFAYSSVYSTNYKLNRTLKKSLSILLSSSAFLFLSCRKFASCNENVTKSVISLDAE